jgi:hypothetical protein
MNADERGNGEIGTSDMGPNETACWAAGGVELNIGIVAGEGDFTRSRKTARWGRRLHPIAQKSRSGDPGACAPQIGYAYIPRSLMV